MRRTTLGTKARWRQNSTLGSVAYSRTSMSSAFELNVRRADDLLVLRLEFVNLQLEPDEAVTPRRLVRVAADADAIIIVHFPPQHIAEEVFPESRIDFPPTSSRLLAGETRLAFRVPLDFDSIPLTLVDLLDWARLEPILVQDEGPIELGANDFLVQSIREPESHHTAIELPFRLILSPRAGSRWEHSSSPDIHDGCVGLWRTTLVPLQAGTSAQLSAVWSPELSESFASFRQSLTPQNRSEIVRISSLSWQRETLQGLFLEQPQLQTELEEWRAKLSRSIFADELRLSALGGWARIRAKFNVPPIPPFLLSDEELLGLGSNTDLFSLEEWNHATAMGRDLRAGTVEAGYLFPFGHRAKKFRNIRRQFTPNLGPAQRVGRLIEELFITIEEPVQSYSGNAGLPFTSIRMLLAVTPKLDSIPEGSVAFVPMLNGVPFAFPIAVTDHAGTVIQTTAAAVWIPEGPSGIAAGASEYANINRVEFAQQMVTFTPRRGRSSGPDNTTMTTAAIELGHTSAVATSGGAEFQPVMVFAHVRIPALDQFALRTGQGSVRIAYHDRYLNAQASRGVFATLVDGVPVNLPASTAGGVVDSLGVKLDGLSADHGVVPNVDELADDAGSAAIAGLGGKLLGQFDLATMIGEVTEASQRPTIKTESQPGRREVKLDWTPPLKDPLPSPLKKSATPSARPALTIKAVLSQPDGTPAPPGTDVSPYTEVTGTLANVALELLNVVRLEFEKIEFHTRTAQKPEFSTDISAVTFLGDLEFVNELASLLRKADGGPTVNVTPSGISAGLTLAVPEFGLGVFALSNLAVSIGVNLYFSARPLEITFALSSRQRPFLMSYSLFGGGGYFALTAKSDGTFDVEAAFEMGAAASINLVVAEAKAQVMVGIMFATSGGDVRLGGYLRIFGSLEILGIATISVDFQLSLTYAAPNATARASLTVSVRVLGFSKSVTISIQRSFNMSNLAIVAFTSGAAVGNHQSFREAVPLEESWVPYCDAFAEEDV